MNAGERQTVATTSDADDVLFITTSQRRVITRLRKAPGVKIIRELHDDEGGIWLEAELPITAWDPVSGVKRHRNISPEAKAAAAERLAAARAMA